MVFYIESGSWFYSFLKMIVFFNLSRILGGNLKMIVESYPQLSFVVSINQFFCWLLSRLTFVLSTVSLLKLINSSPFSKIIDVEIVFSLIIMRDESSFH